MEHNRVFERKRIVGFYLPALSLFFILSFLADLNGPAAGGRLPQGPRIAGVAEGSISADFLAQLGIKACVPRPAVEPPPVTGDAIPQQALAPSRTRPCPEGLVPQPIERWGRRTAGMRGASVAGQNAGTAMAPVPGSTADFYYASAYQFVASAGSYAFLTQHLPAVATGDHHSLAEIAVQSTDRRQIVEVGWTVDRLLNGDDNPHLFVFHWVDGVPSCYNACDWVQFSDTVLPGMAVASDGSAYQYMILFWQGNWWIGYQGEWMGYFPGSLWGGSYTASGLIQWFGEVSVGLGTAAPVTTMGSGALGTSGDPAAARIFQTAIYNDDGTVLGPAAPSFYATNAAWYNTAVDGLFTNWFWYGGRGAAP